MSSPVVLVTSRSFSSGARDVEGELRAAGLDVVRGSPSHDRADLTEPLGRCVAWIAGTAPVTADLLDLAPDLKVVARYGTGTDAVDRTAAADRGVVVTNTPGANAGAVADHTLALLLAALRRVTQGDRDVRAGRYGAAPVVRELGSLTVGVVGFGRIGQAVAKRLTGFGSTLLAADPYPPDTLDGVELTDPDDLFARSDVVTLHAPGGTVIVDAERIAGATAGLLLVNAARADLVDEAAIAAGLRSGALSAYATDTPSGEHGATSPLLADDLADRVVVTPHRAAQSVDAVDRMGGGAAEAVLDVLAGRTPRHVVAPPR